MAAAWIWASRPWILFDFNAHGMDLDAPGTTFNPWNKGCGPKLPPMIVVCELRKIDKAEKQVKNSFCGYCLGGVQASKK